MVWQGRDMSTHVWHNICVLPGIRSPWINTAIVAEKNHPPNIFPGRWRHYCLTLTLVNVSWIMFMGTSACTFVHNRSVFNKKSHITIIFLRLIIRHFHCEMWNSLIVRGLKICDIISYFLMGLCSSGRARRDLCFWIVWRQSEYSQWSFLTISDVAF